MGKKRANSGDELETSKRLCIDENRAENGSIESFDSEMSESDEETNCSQNPDFRPNEPKSEAENGIIEEITLQNFMCHSHLRVPLSPNVNFIIGRNGSGKSAIMTAIVVGLGGKAANTNRGNSMKGFVKDKCSTAVIKIKLKNCGQDAFKPRDYGKHITVERKISHDGTSSYKIFNANGNVVSNKKAELNHILDQFNIQIDNPVSILNQDTSRNFLYASDPGKKYKFFLKATQLEQMNNDYLTIQECQKIMSITLEKKKETIPEMENEVKQLEEKYKDLEQLKVLEGTVEELKKEIAWAQVVEKEKKLKPMIASLNSEKERLPKYDEKLEECENDIAAQEATWGEVKSEMDKISSESDQLSVRQESINGEVRKMKDIVRIHQNELRKMERELHNAERERCELQKRIEDITANAMQDIESERLERERSLQQKRDELQGIQFQLNATNNHKNQVENNVSRLTDQLYQIRNDVADARKNVDQSQRAINSLREGQKDRLKRMHKI